MFIHQIPRFQIVIIITITISFRLLENKIFQFQIRYLFDFYRAMHFSAKRGIAIACRLSVCLSVCL